MTDKCDYCLGRNKSMQRFIPKCNDRHVLKIQIDNKNQLHIIEQNLGDVFWETTWKTEIKFCPYCGRELLNEN